MEDNYGNKTIVEIEIDIYHVIEALGRFMSSVVDIDHFLVCDFGKMFEIDTTLTCKGKTLAINGHSKAVHGQY